MKRPARRGSSNDETFRKRQEAKKALAAFAVAVWFGVAITIASLAGVIADLRKEKNLVGLAAIGFVIAIFCGVAITIMARDAGAFDSSYGGAPRSSGPGAPGSRV
jgi:hypothetical protein